MAKHIVKKKKRSIKVNGLLSMIFALAIITAFGTQTLVRATNNSIAREIEDVNREIINVNVNNEKLTAEIQELSDLNRVVSIAKEAGLETNNKVVTVKNGN